MKKLLLITSAILLIIALAACATSNSNSVPTETIDIEYAKTEPNLSQESYENTPYEDTFEKVGMPKPFAYEGGDENRGFYQPHNIKMMGTAVMFRAFGEHLGLSEEALMKEAIEKWGDRSWERHNNSGLMENNNLYSFIVDYNIPDEVIIDAFVKSNEWYEGLTAQIGNNWEDEIYFDEDIAALLSRDETIITEYFAESAAIVIEGKAYPGMWLYLHTPDDYEAAGITPEMLTQKLDLYAEFRFTPEADVAFSEKLSEFMGEEVSLSERRVRNERRALAE